VDRVVVDRGQALVEQRAVAGGGPPLSA
jgi:hypothetical protein